MTAIKPVFLIIVLTLFFCNAENANAQADDLSSLSTSQLKGLGKNARELNDYSSAMMYYEQYCIRKPKDYKRAFILAECARNARDYRKAEQYYLAAYEKNPKKNALALYHYAMALKSNGKYEKADQYFAKFKKEYKGKDKSQYTQLVKSNAKAAESAKAILKNPLKIFIEPLDTTINTAHIEFGPQFTSDSTMIYASLKSDLSYYYYNPEDSSANEPYRKLYTGKRNNGKWTDAGEMPGSFNKDGFHCGNGAYSPDGNRFYFTRCKKKGNNEVICAIYVSRYENDKWSEPESLGKGVNDPQYTSTQPTVAMDVKKKSDIVYFVSNRPNGRGKLDIWYTVYDAKKKEYKTPVNAGAKLNTTGDEYSPFYDTDLSIMYFSTDGLPGLGGLDIYKSNGEFKKWSTAENMGSPLNSGVDDLYYVLNKKNKEEGFFVSNRAGSELSDKLSCCDNIFYFRWLESLHFFLEGKVSENDSSSKPLTETTLQLELKNDDDSTYVPVKSVVNDKDGRFKMELIPGKDYRLVVKHEGRLSNEFMFTTRGKMDSTAIVINPTIERLPEAAITLKNIYYDFGKSTLTETSKNVIDTTLLRLLINNPDLVIEMGSHTDNKGDDKSNQVLSQRRAESVVNYLVQKGIDKNRLKAKGYGESQPIALNQNADGSDNPEGRQMNRRTEFRIVGKLKKSENEDE